MTGFFEKKNNVRIVVLLMLFGFLLYRFEGALDVLRRLIVILNPLILGTVIALLVNLPMRFLERVLPFDRSKVFRRFKRAICLTLSMLFALALLFLILLVIAPEVKAAIENTIVALPSALKQITDRINALGVALHTDWSTSAPVQSNIQKQAEEIYRHLVTGLTSSTGIISSAASLVMQTFIGFVFAIYLLYSKEKLLHSFGVLTAAYLKPDVATRVHYILRMSVDIFSDFFGGQCIQAFSSAVLTWLVLMIFGIPYPVLIALLVFLTSFVPIFGPYLSGAVAALLVFSKDAGMVGWFLLLFFLVQQFSGSVIYPRIIERAIELPSIWVLVSVTVGGGLMGLAGMLFFIPFTAIVYKLVKEDAAKRLNTAAAGTTNAGH